MFRFVIAAVLLSASAAQAEDPEFFGVKLDAKANQKLEDIYNNTQHGNALLESIDSNLKTLLERSRPEPPAAPAPDLTIELDVPAAVSAPAVEGSVTKIRASGKWYDPEDRTVKQTTFGGSAVAIGDGTFRTVAHLVDGMRSPFTVEVLVGEEWKSCSYQTTPGIDLAVANLPNHKLPAVKTRKPKYLETVWVYGMKTKEMKKGTYTSLGIVSLDQWVHGTDQGDSGGGVFSADGELVGTLKGYQKNLDSAVTFTEVGEEAFAAKPAPKAPAKPAVVTPSPCANGQCPLVPQGQVQWFYPSQGRRK